MGSYTNTYVGIYIELTNTKEEKLVNQIRHPETGKKMDTQYDPETGTKGVSVPESTYETKYANGYINQNYLKDNDLDEDMFWSPSHTGKAWGCTVILNQRNDKYAPNFEGGETFNLDIISILPKSVLGLILEFSEEYKPYLDYYVKEYGKENVKVKYGVVQYAH